MATKNPSFAAPVDARMEIYADTYPAMLAVHPCILPSVARFVSQSVLILLLNVLMIDHSLESGADARAAHDTKKHREELRDRRAGRRTKERADKATERRGHASGEPFDNSSTASSHTIDITSSSTDKDRYGPDKKHKNNITYDMFAESVEYCTYRLN